MPQWYAWRAHLEGDPAIVGFYVGLAVLGLACFGLWRATPRERWLGLASAGFLLLSLGDRLPGYAALVPLHLFRFPATWFLLATAGLALLCAAGVRCLPRARCPSGDVVQSLGVELRFPVLVLHGGEGDRR